MKRKMTLGKKISMGFGIIIIIVLISQINSYSLLKEYHHDVKRYSSIVNEMRLGKDIKESASHLSDLITDAALMKDKNEMNVEAVNLLKQTKYLIEQLKKLNKDDEDHYARLSKIETDFDEVYKLGKGLFYAGVNNNNLEGAMGKFDAKTTEIYRNISKITEEDSSTTSKMRDEMESMANSGETKLIWFSLITLLLSITVGYIITNKIKKPVLYLGEKIKEYEKTGKNIEINVKTNDEINDLANSFQNMIHAQNEKVEGVVALAQGRIADVKIKSDNDPLSKALKTEVNVITEMLEEFDKLVKYSKDGKLDERGDASKFEGSWGKLVAGVNLILDAILLPIQDGVNVLGEIANGDLTARVIADYKGDHQKIKVSINKLGNSFEVLIKELVNAIDATATASTQISSSAEEMAAGAQEQSAQTGEVSAAVEQMAATIVEATQNATEAAGLAKQSGVTANEGGEVVKQTIDGIENIAKVVADAAGIVEDLGVSSNKIGEIIQVIDDIADQTNLLALNAAIEAARAGEQGRGFAVVADEVRKLAERTTTATKEIADMIKQIQSQTAGAVDSMRAGKEETQKGKELASQAGKSLGEIVVGADHVLNAVEQVATASEEQSATVEQISKNVEGINSVAQESAAGVEQIAKASENLNRLTENLQNLVQQFKISDENKLHSNYEINGNGNLYHSENHLLSN